MVKNVVAQFIGHLCLINQATTSNVLSDERNMEIKGIKEFLNEGKSYIELGNSIQASEKLYKAAEEEEG